MHCNLLCVVEMIAGFILGSKYQQSDSKQQVQAALSFAWAAIRSSSIALVSSASF